MSNLLQVILDDLARMQTQIENIKQFAREKDNAELWAMADKLRATWEHLAANPLFCEESNR